MCGSRGSLKAWARSLVSVRWEKRVSRRRVLMCVKVGESMRSEVSSRRRRSGAAWVLEFPGEDVMVVMGSLESSLEGEEVEAGAEAVVMPDSWRTNSSWSRGGRRCGSHLRFLIALLACWLLYCVDSLNNLPSFFFSGTLNLPPYIKCQL